VNGDFPLTAWKYIGRKKAVTNRLVKMNIWVRAADQTILCLTSEKGMRAESPRRAFQKPQTTKVAAPPTKSPIMVADFQGCSTPPH
jgi:hypothetical protein